jgi:lipopolysaccharide/colanic/teichoic acid biosynthesis glycosyltransferase
VLKRGIDVVFAGTLLLVSLPLLLVAAIVIKRDTAGPVFYRQARVGRGGRRFLIWKLRTMRPHCEGPNYTLGDDPRVTRSGEWLRRLKIDELPQLWNVLRGEMSLVGPRPVVPEITEEFRESYVRLLEVRPGLTDPATLKYCHEEQFLELVADQQKYYKAVLIPDKLRLSAEYLDHATVGSDLRLLAATSRALIPDNWRPSIIPAGLLKGLTPNGRNSREKPFG